MGKVWVSIWNAKISNKYRCLNGECACHNILPTCTNVMKKSPQPWCPRSQLNEEDRLHVLWCCEEAQNFWCCSEAMLSGGAHVYWRVLEEGDDRTMHGEFLDIVLDDCM